MAVGAHALCVKDDVRHLLQRQASEIEQDDLIEAFIDRASSAIVNDYGKFRPVEGTVGTPVTKTFVYQGGHRLSLWPYFLQSVSTLSFGSQGTSPTAYTTDDYRLRPPSPMDGVYRSLYLPTSSSNGCEQELTVTGVWGYSTIPDSVKQACAMTVVEWLRREAAYSTAFVIDEGRVDRPEAIPRAAARLLVAYERKGQG